MIRENNCVKKTMSVNSQGVKDELRQFELSLETFP